MEVSVSAQTAELLYSALLGVCLGVMYDVFRIFRRWLGRGRFMTALFDGLYWLAAFCALLGFVMTVSGGVVRWYVLIGAFCGGFVYMCTFSRLIFCGMDIIIKLLIRLLGFISAPIYAISRALLHGARRARGRLQTAACRRREIRRGKRTEKKQKKEVRSDGGKEKKKKRDSA